MAKTEFCNMIDEAIKDEASGMVFYGKMASAAEGEFLTDKRTKQILKTMITNVQEAEGGHKALFESLRYLLCKEGGD